LIASERLPLTDEETAAVAALRAEAEQFEETYAEAEEFPEEVDQRMDEIETALAAIEDRPAIYAAADIIRAGAFVSIDGSGRLRVERGYVCPEDEAPVAEPEASDPHSENDSVDPRPIAAGTDPTGNGVTGPETQEDDEGVRPLPDKLLTELTAYRTLALREAVGHDPAIAFLAALHVLCLKLFYHYGAHSCLEIETKSVMFGGQAPGLADTPLASRVDTRHRAWAEQLPEEPGELWDALSVFDTDSRDMLFAHCVSLTVNTVHEAWNRRPNALAHADRLAEAISLDMAAAGWSPTVDNFFGRVTKARILNAVREAKGDAQAELLAHLKKGDMAVQAEQLLAGSGWLPEPLRTPGQAQSTDSPELADEEADMTIVESAAPESETAIDLAGTEADSTNWPAEGETIAGE
jgi:ParB family chromosome partitioning protein